MIEKEVKMLKSLFFKQKAGTEELLPPPPPFPSMELEEQTESPEDGEFKKLLDVLETQSKQQKVSPKVKKHLKKALKTKAKGKISRTDKTKRIPDFDEFEKLEQEMGLELSEESEKSGEFKDVLKELDISKAESADSEAQGEIQEAIETAKRQEKPSLFRRLFAPRKKPEAEILQEPADDVDAIHNNISKARESLMNLDLEAARNFYTECMRIYNNLSPQDKARVYHDINDLYSERKSAERLKVNL